MLTEKSFTSHTVLDIEPEDCQVLLNRKKRTNLGEHPAKTLDRYFETPQWRNKTIDRESLISQFISISDESNGRPNFNYIDIENGILVSPENNKSILPEIKRSNDIYEREYQLTLQLQDWASKNNQGIALWISPRGGIYPAEKVVIYRIAYKLDAKSFETKKVITHSTILFDADLKETETLRQTLLTFEDDEERIFDILTWVKEKSFEERTVTAANPNEVRQMAAKYVEMYMAGTPKEQIIKHMRENNFLGDNSMSCPTSILLFAGQDRYGSLEFQCPSCNRKNTRPFGQLISNCQHCGADVRC